MKRLWRKSDAKKATRYEIERDYNKRIKAAYDILNNLNKSYDLLTKNAEETFEQKERAFAKEKAQLEQTYQKRIQALKDQHQKTLSAKNKHLDSIERDFKEKREALSLDFKKSSLLLEDDIKALQEERKIKHKEIEKHHKTNTSIFQEKLDLYQENLRKNQAETKALLQKSIETLETQLSTFQSNKEPVFKAFEKDLKTYEEAIDQSFKKERDGTNTHTKRLLNTMTQYRKQFNDLIRTITNAITDSRSALEAPFLEYKKHVQDLQSAFNKQITEANDTLKIDLDFEKQRIEGILKGAPETPIEPKEVKDLNTRLKLATMRKDTLIEQNNVIQTLINNSLDAIDKDLTEEQKNLTDIFENQTQNLRDNHSRFKELFSLIESYIQDISSTTYKATEASHLKSTYNALKTFIEDGFNALTNFEIERLNNHITTTEKLIDIFLEIDDLTLFLDSVEPRKEIEISKQKQRIEEADVSLRLDMQEAKLHHDLSIMKIKHETRIKEHEVLGKIQLIKETEQRDNLIAAQRHDLSILEIEKELHLSKAIFKLRKSHFENDITSLNERQSLEIKQLEEEHKIDVYTVEREAALEYNLVESERDEKTLKQRYQIESLKQSLELAIEKKQKLETIETENYTTKQNTLKRSYEERQHQLQEDIADQKNTLNNRLAFIDRALEKETLKPATNIKEIYAMIEHQNTLLKEHSDPLLTTIQKYEKMLSDPEAGLRSVLLVISEPFKKQLNQWVDKVFDIYQNAIQFVHEVTLERINQETSTERKQQLQRQKAISEHDKVTQKLTKQQAQLKSAFERRIEDAKARVKALDKTTIKNIKHTLTPFFSFIKDNVVEEHRLIKTAIHDTYDTLNTQDKALVERAKNNHKKAQEQAKEKHKNSIEPLIQALKNNEVDYEAELKSLESSLESKKLERTEPLQKQIESIRTQIQALEKEKSAIEEESASTLETIESNLEQQKLAFAQNLENSIASLKNQYQKKVDKLKERLNDAENILNYETRMYDTRTEHQENLKQEAFQTHQQNAETKLIECDREQKAIETEKTKAIQKVKDTLDKENENFENALIASTPKLEAKIEETSRNIDREADLRRDRKHTLVTQSDTMWDTLHKQNEKAAQTLTEQLEIAAQKMLKNFKSQTKDPLDALVNLQNTFIDSLIKKTIKDIIKRD